MYKKKHITPYLMAYLKLVSPVVQQRIALAGSCGNTFLQTASAEFTRWIPSSIPSIAWCVATISRLVIWQGGDT